MKKLYFIAIILVITSCGSSNRICGGSGGKRCVEINTLGAQNTITLEKSILS